MRGVIEAGVAADEVVAAVIVDIGVVVVVVVDEMEFAECC
jgi:hypothetical protein